MTEIVLNNGTAVHTELTPLEIRHYMQKGVSTSTFDGYLDAGKTKKILILATSIAYVII